MRLRHKLAMSAVCLAVALVTASCPLATRPARGARESTPPPEKRLTFLAVGDMMISRGVARAIRAAGDTLVPFQKMEEILLSTDFNFANLESPISGRNHIAGKGLVFNTRESDAFGLREYNFRVLNLANNHALDMGLKGLRRTMELLDRRDLTYVGVGETLDEAWRPKTLVINGMKIGFVGASYASLNDGGVARNAYVARIEDTARLKDAIDRLQADGADFIIATMHAGVEYTRRPDAAQINFARAAIDHGADIVIGSHPHWVQEPERYRGRMIFYSLGNFIFDQEWSRDTREGLALKVSLHKQAVTRIEQIELIPVIIDNYSTPRPATDIEARQILKKIGVAERVIRPEAE